MLSLADLMKYIDCIDRGNSVSQITIRDKDELPLVLQEEEGPSIENDVKKSPQLERMLKESEEQYK